MNPDWCTRLVRHVVSRVMPYGLWHLLSRVLLIELRAINLHLFILTFLYY
jgi:hypothetical protein